MPSDDTANLEAMSEARAYQQAMADLVVRELGLRVPAPAEGVLLDFGSGRGDYARELQGRTSLSLVGLEPDESQHAHYPADVSVIRQLDQLSSKANAVYSLNVLEHIADDVAALRSLAAYCKPGALMLLLVPAHPKLWTAMDTRVGHQRRYTPETLRACVTQAGLKVLREGWFDRTGYWATRAYQIGLYLKSCLTAISAAGSVSPTQAKLFDLLFQALEPSLSKFEFGKNCWVLVQCPIDEVKIPIG